MDLYFYTKNGVVYSNNKCVTKKSTCPRVKYNNIHICSTDGYLSKSQFIAGVSTINDNVTGFKTRLRGWKYAPKKKQTKAEKEAAAKKEAAARKARVKAAYERREKYYARRAVSRKSNYERMYKYYIGLAKKIYDRYNGYALKYQKRYKDRAESYKTKYLKDEEVHKKRAAARKAAYEKAMKA